MNRLFSAALMGIFAWMVTGPAMAAALESANALPHSSASHADGAPCPDGGDSGPCDDGCPCLCCPGHGTAASAPTPASLEGPLVASLNHPNTAESDPPIGIAGCVFRPPRA